MIGLCGHHAEAPDVVCARCRLPRVPIRRKADYCLTCGMSEGRHWTGCPEVKAS